MTEIRKVRPAYSGKKSSSWIVVLPKNLCEKVGIAVDKHVTLDVQGKTIIIKDAGL